MQPAPVPSQRRRLLTKLQGYDACTQPELELQQAVGEVPAAAGLSAAAGGAVQRGEGAAMQVALGQYGGMQQMLGHHAALLSSPGLDKLSSSSNA